MDVHIGILAAVAGVGVLMGLLTSLVGLPMKFEFPTWTVLYVALAIVAGVSTWAGFGLFVAASTVGGLGTGIIQTLLLDPYRKNNPWSAADIPEARGQAVKMFLPFALMMGAVFGAAFAGVSWAISSL